MSRMASGDASTRWQHVPMGGEVRPELQDCIFTPNILSACPYVGGRVPLSFESCVTASASSFQWDHQMDHTDLADLVS